MTRITDIVRAQIGSRCRITRREMRQILADLASFGLVKLDNGWQEPRPDGDHAAAWADMCCGISVISVLADDEAITARAQSSNPGSIRYDDPGGMHPQLRATLIFAPAELADLQYDQIGQLRRRATRVLVVEEED